MIENTRCINLRDMHPMQAYALHDFVGWAIDLAALVGDEDLLKETEGSADELVRMFGGKGVRMEIER